MGGASAPKVGQMAVGHVTYQLSPYRQYLMKGLLKHLIAEQREKTKGYIWFLPGLIWGGGLYGYAQWYIAKKDREHRF